MQDDISKTVTAPTAPTDPLPTPVEPQSDRLAGAAPAATNNSPDRITKFVSSGLFFMIVGTMFLWIAFGTMGSTHAAMSFVFVVVGVAILLYGTGTQGMGQFDSGQTAEQVARYKVALAGGAGAIAFCVAAGIIAFSHQMKDAFQIEQKYLRLHIKGSGYVPEDIGLYLPDIRINGNPAPAVRRGDYIEVYAPYVLNSTSSTFEVRAKLHLIEPTGLLRKKAEHVYNIVLKSNRNIEEDGKAAGSYATDAGYDFPRYTLKKLIELKDDERRVSGEVPK